MIDMIKILSSNTQAKASKLVYEELREARKKGGRHVIIVSDRFTLSTERNLMKELGVSGVFDVEVMSFTRLAKRILSSTTRRSLSPEGAVMLMRRAIDDVKDELSSYGRSCSKPGFAGEMFAAIASVRNNSISPEELLEASEKLRGISALKLRDVATIYARYEELISSGYEDMTSRLNALADEIPESSDVAETSFYVMEFTSCTAVQLRILNGLFKCARNVTVGVLSAEKNPNRSVLNGDLKQKLVGMAYRSGKSVEERYAEDDALTPESALINKYLFSYEKADVMDTDKVMLYSASSLYDEICHVASVIRYLVINKKMRYQDVAVICPSEEYKSIIKEVFSAQDIVYFADVKSTALSHPASKLITSYLRLKNEGISCDLVFELVKNPLFLATDKEKDLFENYCLAYSVDRTGFFSPFEYGGEGSAPAESVRKKLLELLGGRTQLPALCREHVGELRAFLERAGWEGACAELKSRQEEAGDLAEASFSSQICDVIHGLLDELEELSGEVKMTEREFLGVLESMLTEAKISLIPFYLDCVYVGDTRDSRYSGMKAMFLIGAVEGRLPAIRGESGILSESELSLYRSVGINVEPNAPSAYREEKAVLTELLTKPTDLLCVSFSTGAGNEESKPSSVIRELASLFNVRIHNSFTFPKAHPEIYLYRFSTMKSASAELAVREDGELDELRKALCMERTEKRPARRSVAIPEHKLFRKGTTYVSQLETYFTCPYRHFLQYVLKLKERKEGVESTDVGTYVHAVLEQFLKECDLEKNDEECARLGTAIAERVLEEEYPFIAKESPVHRDLLTDAVAIVKDVVKRQRHTSFKPEFFEARIGEGGDFPSVDIAGLKLVGFIDRIDVFESSDGKKYVAVIDYKSGNPKGDLNELYFGKKIQLYAYLSSIVERGYEPAGVYYYPVNTAYDTETSKKHTLKGYALDDLGVIVALDDTVNEGEAKYLQIKIKNDGTPSGSIVSEEEFRDLIKYSKRVAEGAINEIREGYVAPSPSGEKECEWCAYRSLCSRDVSARSTSKAVDKEIFKEADDGEQY